MRIKDASSVLSVKNESIIPKIAIRKKAIILQPSKALVSLKGARFAIADIPLYTIIIQSGKAKNINRSQRVWLIIIIITER